LPRIVFVGTVFSGKGEGKKFLDLFWVKQQIKEKLGFTPFAGTLNIRLTKDSANKKGVLEKAPGIEVEPQAGYCPGEVFRACIADLDCAIVIPKVPNYPSDVLEIIAPIYLRGKLKLMDGSKVKVVIAV
jgi:riboflavin kinase, archaea type